jgi:hypothetical protein
MGRFESIGNDRRKYLCGSRDGPLNPNFYVWGHSEYFVLYLRPYCCEFSTFIFESKLLKQYL